MLIDCDKSRELCSKLQYEEASFWDKIRLKFHNLFCKPCKIETKEDIELTKLLTNAELKMLSEASKKRLRGALEQSLHSH